MVFIRALNKYLETEELDCEKLKVLSSSLSMQGKQILPKEETETLETPNDKKATVKREQKPVVSISKFKRDFKISGQIGDVSLVHQIENGLKNDYAGDEIKEALIKAINPASSLRSYLDGKADLTLTQLRRIMRSHYQERTATELYHPLSSTVQPRRGEGGIPLYGLYRYVRPQRIWFFSRVSNLADSRHKWGMVFVL